MLYSFCIGFEHAATTKHDLLTLTTSLITLCGMYSEHVGAYSFNIELSHALVLSNFYTRELNAREVIQLFDHNFSPCQNYDTLLG